jgi:predicted Rossmann fold nucleotide-binding protein DprA/Smf involved in DNA uptake
MRFGRRIAVVGSRTFTDYGQVSTVLANTVLDEDSLVSGGAVGVDSMAQRYAREFGLEITIIYPNYGRYGKGATFHRNRQIVEHSDLVLAFYAKGRFQQGGTSNTIHWAQELGVPYIEYEEELVL